MTVKILKFMSLHNRKLNVYLQTEITVTKKVLAKNPRSSRGPELRGLSASRIWLTGDVMSHNHCRVQTALSQKSL